MGSQKQGARILSVFASVTRLHIVAIASLGTLTFGWVLTGRWYPGLALLSALDWFLVNLLNRVVDVKEDQANGVEGSGWAWNYRKPIVFGGIAVLVGSLVLGALWWPLVTAFRVAYHALGLAYNWPLLPGKRRIKELYFWKNTASAVGFLLTVFAYPIAYARAVGAGFSHDISWVGIAWMLAFFFLFELSYEVIYDLRDVEGDALAHVATYPVVHGIDVAGRIVVGLMLVSSALLVLGYAVGHVPWRGVVMVLAPLFQLGYYELVSRRRGIRSSDCIALTWIGAAMLAAYDLWALLELPGVGV